jgi:hypothetical protein
MINHFGKVVGRGRLFREEYGNLPMSKLIKDLETYRHELMVLDVKIILERRRQTPAKIESLMKAWVMLACHIGVLKGAILRHPSKLKYMYT